MTHSIEDGVLCPSCGTIITKASPNVGDDFATCHKCYQPLPPDLEAKVLGRTGKGASGRLQAFRDASHSGVDKPTTVVKRVPHDSPINPMVVKPASAEGSEGTRKPEAATPKAAPGHRPTERSPGMKVALGSCPACGAEQKDRWENPWCHKCGTRYEGEILARFNVMKHGDNTDKYLSPPSSSSSSKQVVFYEPAKSVRLVDFAFTLANLTIACTILAGGILGAVSGAAFSMRSAFGDGGLEAATHSAGSGGVIGFIFGALLGWLVGSIVVLVLKLQAQATLCLAKVEEHQRNILSALEGRAQN
jgi:hypothetical protein